MMSAAIISKAADISFCKLQSHFTHHHHKILNNLRARASKTMARATMRNV